MQDLLQLHVFFENQTVGRIHYSPKEDEFRFEYSDEWKTHGRFQISPHIRYEGHENGVVKRFLENLLPEGKGLTDLSKLMKVPKSNVYALINAIGRDLSGALRIQADQETTPTVFRKISEEEFRQRIQERSRQPITTWDGKPRLSVAGVQDKLPVVKKQGEYGLGEGQLASTHILKFERDRGQHIVLNEFYCMRLAQKTGLNVASVEIMDLGERVLEVERFDRSWKTPDTVERRHVIDACQATDLSPDHKYERFLGDDPSVQDILGPANLENLYGFCDQCQNPAKARLDLLQWVIFNLLIGNSDNHFKNVSYFVNDDGIHLAPFYDLLSVTVYKDFNPAMAFAIGECFEPDQVDEHQLVLMAHELNLGPAFIKRQLRAVIKNLEKALKQIKINEASMTKEEREFLQKLSVHFAGNVQRYREISEKI